jgi:hypothetical protein
MLFRSLLSMSNRRETSMAALAPVSPADSFTHFIEVSDADINIV